MTTRITSAEQFVRDIKGPAASILWYLMLTGSSHTRRELETATNYSDKLVKRGVDQLIDYGLAQDNGLYGISINHQLPLPFRELWQGHHGKFLEDGMDDNHAQTGRPQAAARSTDGHKFPPAGAGSQDTLPGTAVTIPPPQGSEIPIPGIGISDPLVVDCLVDCQSMDLTNNQSSNQSSDGIGNSDLPALLRRLRIVGTAYTDLCRRQTDPAHVLAWHWYVCCQTWLNRNPTGYVIARLRERQEPPAEWLSLARWWRSLDEDGRDLVQLHLAGRFDGRLYHLPAVNGGDLAHWLRPEMDAELPETAVLDALVELSQAAPQEITR